MVLHRVKRLGLYALVLVIGVQATLWLMIGMGAAECGCLSPDQNPVIDDLRVIFGAFRDDPVGALRVILGI